MVHVAGELWEAGADGINFDTAGAGGDADLLATLLAVERLRAAYPAMGIMVGMAAEDVLGTHGELDYRGTRVGRAQARGPVPGGAGGGRHHLRARRQRQHEPHGGLERRPGA